MGNDSTEGWISDTRYRIRETLHGDDFGEAWDLADTIADSPPMGTFTSKILVAKAKRGRRWQVEVTFDKQR
jgi:hypothetical protein